MQSLDDNLDSQNAMKTFEFIWTFQHLEVLGDEISWFSPKNILLFECVHKCQ